ncbi:MAG: energy transducer TonB [bacterium]
MRTILILGVSILAALAIFLMFSSSDSSDMPDGSVDTTAIPPPESFVHAEQQPEPLDLPLPKFPEEAKIRGVEGQVYVKVFVDANGDVQKAIVLKESGKNVGFEEAAIRAARQGKWKPAISPEGEPIGVWVAYPIKFTLR